MEAIISWSNVERFMLNVYIQMMGGPTELTAIAFLSLEIQSAKSAVLNAIAEEVLEEHYRALLMAIIKFSKNGQSGRDKLAHWTWGYSPQIPDAFLLANPKNTYADILPEKIYVYRESDFSDIIDHNDRACGYGLRFNWIVRGHPGNRDDALYHELCAEPAIREILDRQA